MSAPQKMSRKVKWVLGASLALNLLFVGVFAGAAFRYGGGPGSAGTHLASYGVPYMQALPRQERRALHKALRREGVLPSKKQRRAAYGAVLEALRADPFDAETLSKVIATQGATVQAVQSAAQAAWLRVVTEMSGADRRAYADALEHRLTHRRRGGHKKPRD